MSHYNQASKLHYFNAALEQRSKNFEQQPKRKISTPTEYPMSCHVIGPVSGTTTPKHMFGKLSSSSTSSVASCTLSAINSAELTQTQHMTINPFEETNRFRLEQSVLSPNLFHVANTSTPERDTNSLWNIDQRAILYPADIQTDESSLMAQYVYDYKMSKQVIPAVEAFWTQNKIIIESPLTCTTGSAIRAKFASNSHLKQGKSMSTNSPLSAELINNNTNQKSSSSHRKQHAVSTSGGIYANGVGASSNVGSEARPANSNSSSKAKRACKDQVSQTLLTIPMDYDLSKILELKNFYITEEESTDSPRKELNNSIRKKLFDQHSEDLSSSTTTTTTATVNTPNGSSRTTQQTNGASILRSKIKSATFASGGSRISQLPKPEVYTNMENNGSVKKPESKLRTLASSSSSTTTEDCWRDSFDFDDHQFASSPKFDKFSNILHDIGDFHDNENLHDSVFEHQHQHRTPPDLSPLLPDSGAPGSGGGKNSMTPINECRTPTDQEGSHIKQKDSVTHKQHHNRFFHFDLDQPNTGNDMLPGNVNHSAVKKEKNLSSPNLSPIRLQETSEPTLPGSCSQTKKKLIHSSNKETTNESATPAGDDMNMSSSSVFAKSIIFMDVGENHVVADLDDSTMFRNPIAQDLQNCSFDQEIHNYEHHNHHKREEFYKRVSLGDDDPAHTVDINNDKNYVAGGKTNRVTDSAANNTSSTDNFSMIIQTDGLKNPQHHLESTKSESDTNFKQMHPGQLAEDEYSSTNIEAEIESSKSKTCLSLKLNANKQHQQQGNSNNNVSNSNHTSMTNYSMMSKPGNNFLTSMIETTTNTFNQDSQDTGYQTNSGICGSTNNNSAQSSSNPSMMIMDTTSNNNNHNNLTNSDITSNCIFASSAVGANNTKSKKKIAHSAVPMNVEMYSENEKENGHYPSLDSSSLLETIANKQSDLNHLKNNLKTFIANSTKRPKNLDVKSVYCNKSLYSQPSTKSLKTKKNSISLNSLEKIIQVEPLSTGEAFRINFSANSHFKPIKPTKSLNDSTNSSNNNSNKNNNKKQTNQQLTRVNFIKHKSDGIVYNSNSKVIQKLNLESTSLTNGSGIHEPLVSSCDISMTTLNNSNSTNWRAGQSCLESGLDLDDTEMLIKKKHELDSLYMDQSILLNKIAPSEYAKNVITKAKRDLNIFETYMEKTVQLADNRSTSHVNRRTSKSEPMDNNN